MKKKVAFFDIDGTLFRSSLLIELVEVMVEGNILPESIRSGYEKERVRWLDRKGNYEAYIDALVEVFMKNLKGVSYADLERAARVVHGRYRNRSYRFTRDLLLKLRRERYFLVAISQSPKIILDLFCKEYGFDKIYGRFFELGPQDRFTGVVTDEHIITNKANIVRRVVAKENLTLAGSIGVGDTEGDIGLLENVENAICFNPNAKLFSWAKRNNARVVVERKDVIYEIATVLKK